ncbi:AraC family transcriptional regulator [Thioclava sp. GXIMD2076]|uniref:AraC family transcriptional regulator n=1 Tax=Thioclava kandeliae TaxID=3070818 RepID=A0ABV1SLE5_9RHOB
MSPLYDTTQVAAAEQLSFWEDVVHKIYAPCVGTAADRQSFQAQLHLAQFGPMVISDVRSSPITYNRRPADISLSSRDDYHAIIMLAGRTFLRQSGREVWANTGDIYLYSSAYPYQHHTETPYRSMALRIPRSLALGRLERADDMNGRILKANSPYNRIVTALIHEGIALAAHDDAEGQIQRFSSSVLDLIAAAISAGTCEGQDLSSRGRKLMLRVQRYMRDNLEDPELGLADIAQAQGISTRTLTRMFADMGTTPMAWLQSQRLAVAYAALAEGRVDNVSEAAFTYGFNDSSYFGRAFKKVYGFPPKTLLDQQ